MGKQSCHECKTRSSCKDAYRVDDNSKVWTLLNFYEQQTEEFADFSLLSKNPNEPNYFNHAFAEMGQHLPTPAELRKSI